MKRILIFLLVAMGVLTSKAQIIENGENNIMWGARVAFDVNLPGKVHSNVIDDRMFRNGTGATAGAVCNIYLGKKFYLEPALSLFYDTYTYKGLTIAGDNYKESDPALYKAGFRMPVVIGYSISISDQLSIAPYTGPEMSYAFAGAVKVHDKDRLDIDTSLFGGTMSDQRRFECGWKIGIAFFSGMWSLNIDGTIGMTNLMKNGLNFRESRGSVSLTRYF